MEKQGSLLDLLLIRRAEDLPAWLLLVFNAFLDPATDGLFANVEELVEVHSVLEVVFALQHHLSDFLREDVFELESLQRLESRNQLGGGGVGFFNQFLEVIIDDLEGLILVVFLGSFPLESLDDQTESTGPKVRQNGFLRVRS